ncbi:MAG: Phosphoesterase, family protein [Oscillospiraceae bacterium]|nr:Phosphoesterase, family protein [Oscillospiraceae bacterium]
MNKKITKLLEPRFELYFICLLLFAAAAGFYDLHLAAGEVVVVVCLFFFYRHSTQSRQRTIRQYMESVSMDMDLASKDSMLNSPLPMVIFRPDTGEVIWSNERFLQITGEREHMFDTKLKKVVPDFSTRWLMEGKSESPKEVPLRDRTFRVVGTLVRTGSRDGQGLLATTYWIDVTEFIRLRKFHDETRPVVAILLLDNYEETMKNVPDNVRTAMHNEIYHRISAWIELTEPLFSRFDRDRFLLVLTEQHYQQLKDGKFSVLDRVHEIQNPTNIPVTLSIGVGKDADSFKELYQNASLSIEMALSRGGDQVVVKNRNNFEFYGGRAKEMEKRTKVKSRVMANAVGELIGDSSQVFVMGHKFPDLDSIGAAAGVCAIARKRGVPAFIVKEPGENPAKVMVEKLSRHPAYETVFISAQDAIVAADPRTLLVVVDTNRPGQVQAENLLSCCNRVVVIDHHRRAAAYIADAALNFHEPSASSACELVTELIEYIMDSDGLLNVEAEALLAGIYLDTKNFTMRTGGRTFETAAFLRRCGADTEEVKKLFQNNLAETLARFEIVKAARMYHGTIAVVKLDRTVSRVSAAQAADELLNISGIESSFVIFPDGDRVIVSARSLGVTNVQMIVEKLGGGGNAINAGAQIVDSTPDEVHTMLLRAIDECVKPEPQTNKTT